MGILGMIWDGICSLFNAMVNFVGSVVRLVVIIVVVVVVIVGVAIFAGVRSVRNKLKFQPYAENFV